MLDCYKANYSSVEQEAEGSYSSACCQVFLRIEGSSIKHIDIVINNKIFFRVWSVCVWDLEWMNVCYVY